MATYVPAKRAVAYRTWISLVDRAARPSFRTNPTLAVGDVKVSKDGGALANLTTLPVVTPASSALVQVDLSASEMTADVVTIIFQDAAGAEWDDILLVVPTVARQVDDLAFPAVSGRSIAIDASGRIDLGLWIGVAPSALNSGLVQSDVERWVNVVPNALVGGRLDIIGVVRTGTATASSASTLTLDAGAPATLDYFRNDTLVMTSGVAVGQSRRISTYSVGRVATVSPNWDTTPGATDTFAIISKGRVDLAEWIGVVPSALNSGLVQADVERWINVAPSALIAGNVPSNTQAMAVDVIDATALALSAGQEIADRVLARNLAGGSDAGRVVRDALRALRNKVDATLGIVYQEDDSTTAWTFVITTAVGNPVTIVDPA